MIISQNDSYSFNKYTQSLPVAAPVTIAIKRVTTKPSIWNPAWSATDLSSPTSGNKTEKLSKNSWYWNSMVCLDNIETRKRN